MGDWEISDQCPGDICRVSWKYLIGVLEIFDRCSWRYLIGFLEIFDWRPGDI